jgi:hypothetical protein
VESSCKATAQNKNATNGKAVGPFQLDDRPSSRKWRGEYCKEDISRNPKLNSLCAAEILLELLEGKTGRYDTNGKIFGPGSNSYWEELRKVDGKIGKLISLHPFCSGKTGL